MFIITGGRQSGKTVKAIHKALEEGLTLVVEYNDRVCYVRTKCAELGVFVRTIITFDNLRKYSAGNLLLEYLKKVCGEKAKNLFK